MSTQDSSSHDVEIAPLESKGTLCGFLLLGRWPVNTVEWAKFLVLAVRMAAVPGLLPSSTVYAVHDDVADRPHPKAVGIITAAGRAIGKDALKPGALAEPRPHGLVVLHPPSHTIPSDPEFDTASGCVFLPGLPHLGLDHRAAWAQASIDGTVTQLVSRGRIDPLSDADTAALSAFIAA